MCGFYLGKWVASGKINLMVNASDSPFFFFRAEDGIRDAQESRGLGDVYKRQGLYTRICLPENKRLKWIRLREVKAE